MEKNGVSITVEHLVAEGEFIMLSPCVSKNNLSFNGAVVLYLLLGVIFLVPYEEINDRKRLLTHDDIIQNVKFNNKYIQLNLSEEEYLIVFREFKLNKLQETKIEIIEFHD